jgi:hypothetical protein
MIDTIGAAGMVVLLGAFLVNAMGRLSSSGVTYHALNGVGAGILAWYSVQLGVWVFAVLESVWALAALWSLVRALARREAE